MHAGICSPCQAEHAWLSVDGKLSQGALSGLVPLESAHVRPWSLSIMLQQTTWLIRNRLFLQARFAVPQRWLSTEDSANVLGTPSQAQSVKFLTAATEG